MAIIKKTLFPKNLDKYAVLVNDTQSDSRYFKITELPTTFTGGKNAFLIAGSTELVPDTRIQIELKDSAGNVIYHEPGEGLISSSMNGESFTTEYFEGVSKVVAVYIYPDTAYGPCTLTILGELSEYELDNGIKSPVPMDWENKYNVKWQKQIDVNPSLANTTKIRFYQRPQATITELLSPIYRIENDLKVATSVTQSFANIKLSRLETFAGDVKRIKVFRTSEGDISDYSLIQDVLIESKELLTSYGLSGSVVGNTGILTQETLKNYWNTGSLNAYLTSSRVESGVRLTGSGYFTYTSSLDIKSTNAYELNFDAFYSSSTNSNLEIYLASGSLSSSIGILEGITPTKNLLDTVIPFKINTDYPSASLYFSQSQGEWHLGNISLKLSQDTAFSPDEVSFVTTMPTVVGNETYNFKFEFYDVNNNYVPVAVTQSKTFTGGSTGSAVDVDLILSSSISSSLSQSLDALYKVSSSISGTVTYNSSSISGSLTNVSSSVSGTITTLSSSVSQSVAFSLSSSLSKVKLLADGGYPGTFIESSSIYSPTIGGQQGYISKLFTVGSSTSATINMDARNTADGAPDNLRRIWIGTQPYGYHNNTNTAVYFDSAGKFSLKDKLVWTGSDLTIQGTLKIADGTGVASSTDLSSGLSGKISTGGAAGDVNSNSTTISGGKIRTGTIESTGYAYSSGNFSTTGTQINLDNGLIRSKNFAITSAGDAYFKGDISGASGTFGGSISIGSGNSIFKADSNGIYLGNATFASAPFRVTPAGALTATGANISGTITSTDASLGGWIVNSNSIYKGLVSLNSATPEIKMDGTITKIRIGTKNLAELSGTGDQRTVYLGEGGIKVTGDWNTDLSEYKSYITIAADSAYAKAIFLNNIINFSSELVYMSALPMGNNATLRVANGGAIIRNSLDPSLGYNTLGNSGYALQVLGEATVTGDLTANTSDKRLKTNIVNIDSPLEKISKINGVYFNWNELAKELVHKNTEKREVGFIAQEVQEVLPEVIKPAGFDIELQSGENYLTIQYEKIVPLLVECIKELKAEIEELKNNK